MLRKWAFYYDIAQYGRINFMVTAKPTECVLFTQHGISCGNMHNKANIVEILGLQARVSLSCTPTLYPHRTWPPAAPHHNHLSQAPAQPPACGTLHHLLVVIVRLAYTKTLNKSAGNAPNATQTAPTIITSLAISLSFPSGSSISQ